MSVSIDVFDPKLRPTRAQIPSYKPTPEEEKFIRDGLSFLVLKHPFFAHLFYHEMELRYSEAIPWAATDARSIWMNPKRMIAAGWTIKNVAFVLAHEIGHVIFNDLILAVRFRKDGFVVTPNGNLPYSHELMNISEDYRINGMLVHAKVGDMPNVGLFDQNLSAQGMESSIEIYMKLFKNARKVTGGQPGKPGDEWGEEHGGFDIHIQPSDKQVDADDTGRREQAVAAAAEAAQAAGKGDLPAAIQRLLGDILEPKVSWKDHLRSSVLRNGGDPTYDWRYLDKRLMMRAEPMYFARQAHMGAGTIVIAGDTSGSIDDATLNVFFSEMNGICADLNPERIVVMWCDAHVHRVDDLEDVEDLSEYKTVIDGDGGPGGGGGTDFRPVFNMIAEMGLQPDMLIYLTDMYGTFPKNEPDYPVIWGSITEDYDHPFGEFIHVDLSQ